jgi:hypothetical protein
MTAHLAAQALPIGVPAMVRSFSWGANNPSISVNYGTISMSANDPSISVN